MSTSEITVTAFVRAPLEVVWNAWTDPRHIVAWNAASDDWHTTDAKVDLRVGGTFSSRMEAKDGSIGFDFVGTYTAVDVHRHLAYVMDDGRRCSVTFAAQASGDGDGDGVRVTERFDAEDENGLDLQRQGWQAILDRFASYAEALV